MAHGVAKRGAGAFIQRDWESSKCRSFNCRRTVHIFHQTGGVCKKKYPRERAFRKLTKPLELYILHLVLNRPGIYLRELTTNLLDTTGVEVADSTICKFLRVGFTRQKMTLVAKQRDESLRTTVADLGFHEGGFVKSGALARPRNFFANHAHFGQKPRPFA